MRPEKAAGTEEHGACGEMWKWGLSMPLGFWAAAVGVGLAGDGAAAWALSDGFTHLDAAFAVLAPVLVIPALAALWFTSRLAAIRTPLVRGAMVAVSVCLLGLIPARNASNVIYQYRLEYTVRHLESLIDALEAERAAAGRYPADLSGGRFARLGDSPSPRVGIRWSYLPKDEGARYLLAAGPEDSGRELWYASWSREWFRAAPRGRAAGGGTGR